MGPGCARAGIETTGNASPDPGKSALAGPGSRARIPDCAWWGEAADQAAVDHSFIRAAAGIGGMDDRPEQSADCPCDGESHLAAPFWQRPRQDDHGFWSGGKRSFQSCIARLSGGAVYRLRMVDQETS